MNGMLRSIANQAVALGEDMAEGIVLEHEPRTVEERLTYLEQVLKQHTISLDSIYTIIKDTQKNNKEACEQAAHLDHEIEVNRSDNKIPVGTRLKGLTKGVPFWCMVRSDGFYVGITRYESLSAAAEGVSGVRRSGWTFWKFDAGKHEGRSVKEVYREGK